MADAILDWDTFVSGNDSIVTGPQEAYRIRMIGTDKTAAITPRISGNDLGAIRQEVGSIHPTGSQEQGMLDLDNLYYYLPPETELTFDGAGGDLVRLAGEAIDSPASRFEMGADETRFREQGEHHYTFVQGSVDVSEAISDGDEFEPFSLTPNTDERFTFDGLHSTSQTSDGGYSTSEGEISYFFDFDGQRRPSQFADDRIIGLDHTSLPRPPTDSTDQQEFVYGMDAPNVDPFTVSGDQTFRVVGRNTSGGSLGSGGDTSTFTYTAAVEFREGVS